MNWNKNTSKYKRSRLTRDRRKDGFWARLGLRADSWWQKVKGRKPDEAVTSQPSTPPDVLDELKIATPRLRTRPDPKDMPPATDAVNLPETKALESRPDDGTAINLGPKSTTLEAAPGETAKKETKNDPTLRVKKSSPALIDQAAPPPSKRKKPVDARKKAPSTSRSTSLTSLLVKGTQPEKAQPAKQIMVKKSQPERAKSLEQTSIAASGSAEAVATDKVRPDSRPAPRKSAKPSHYRWAAAALALIAVGAGLYFLVPFLSQKDAPPAKVARIPAPNLPKVAPIKSGFYELLAQEYETTVGGEVKIEPGSTLGKAMEALGVGMSSKGRAAVQSLTSEGGVDVVRPGAIIKAFWGDKNKSDLKRLEYHPAAGGAPYVVMPRADGNFWRYSLASQAMTVTGASEGIVNSSLWEAGSKAGLDANLIMNLADVMASELDFLSDIKKGDTFQVLYQREYRDGRPQGSPVIEMVRMTSKGKDYEFYHYVDSSGKAGYYDVNFRSSAKTFFVSPLQYKRISSGFTMNRLHPIHKVVRPHQGVDYAAPSGTPVSTVADGTVIFCGWSGGYGRLVTIKHDETYTTMYAHLSKFGAGIKKGVTVKQGDLIGYVGASGTATGPHLDFRLKKNGVFIDPVPELAKQQGKAMAEDDKQKFTNMLTAARNRMTHYLAKNASLSGKIE